MIYAATQKIESTFKANNIRCRINETQSTSAVEAGFTGENTQMTVRFISTDNDNDVAARILSFVKVPANKRSAVLEAINGLHRRFRYASFSVDDDGDVVVAYDFPLRTSDPGDIAVEMFIRLVKIADQAYPELMKAIWS